MFSFLLTVATRCGCGDAAGGGYQRAAAVDVDGTDGSKALFDGDFSGIPSLIDRDMWSLAA